MALLVQGTGGQTGNAASVLLATSARADGARLAYLDWLRFFVVLSLAPFDEALSYTGMGVVYV